MTNSLTYTNKIHADPSRSCPASNTRVQLHEADIRDEKRRCWGCGRVMKIRPIRTQNGVTLGYAGIALISEHRPHT